MKVLWIIIIIVFFVLGLILSGIESYFKNKLAKVTNEQNERIKQQNELLWAVLKESNDISKELIAMNLKKEDKQDESLLHQ